MNFHFTSNVPDPRIHSEDFSNSLEGNFAEEENDICDAILMHINQVLMEDDSEDKASMFQDSTLHAVEKSLYKILNDESRSSPSQNFAPEDTSSSLEHNITHCCLAECGMISDPRRYKSSHLQNPLVDHNFLTDSLLFCPPSCSCDSTVDELVDSLLDVPPENQPSWRFNTVIEESKNIVPDGGCEIICLDSNTLNPSKVAREKVSGEKVEEEKDGGDLPDSLIRVRKSLQPEENDLEEGRSSKTFAVQASESVLHDLFDKVMSIYNGKIDSMSNDLSRKWQQNESNLEMTYTKKGASRRKAVGMRNLLIKCVESVAGNDHRSASNLLKEIRARSSLEGDGSQRLAHYFADGLEARLLGSGSLDYKTFSAWNMVDSDMLKAYKLYLSVFPFMETNHLFANEMIVELAEKASSIHIIHFGIAYGFQWPPLIQRLSTRPGGPPKLRITGIDLPQAGFKPDAMVKETGSRLAGFCEKFCVPFQYNGISQKWETLRVDDLGIEEEEVLVVNCLYSFRYLLDDSVLQHSPLDAVLNLIRRINPDIFIHGIINGAYNSPFFVSRFREALFHFSVFFDMFEAYVPRQNQERMVFERVILGNKILNVVACEGSERVDRPETYKQWQSRTLRAGFRQLPLNQEIMKKVRAKVKSRYRKEFFVDEASQWMLEGWKGRVITAFSCWKPA